MANVTHASLTGSELHEPKGASSAPLGTVYVANGAGSGSWSSIGTSAFTGMVADFLSPVAPAGWLELDGSVISTTTYSALYGAMSLTTSGTRTNGSPTVTSIPDTSTFKAGYYVFGVGIASGTTILSVDSSTQITLSANASSPSSSSFVVSPWLLNTGTIKLPDVTTSGRYRRSRTTGSKVGDLQADQNKAHTHTLSGTTASEGAHTHSYSGNTGTQSSNHTHNYQLPVNSAGQTGGGAFPAQSGAFTTTTTGVENQNHSHAYSGTTAAGSAHTHTFSTTSDSSGGTDVRPLTLVVLTCVKT